MDEQYELYLIRHGVAAERGDAWPDDNKRPLTSRGIARLKKEVKGLVALEVSLDQILTSPLVRARQTAEVIAEALPSKPPLANSRALMPGGRYNDLIDELSKYSRRRRIALVGHEPDLGAIAARLLGARGTVEFKKGAVCRIDFEALPPARPGHLVWLAPPKLLRAIG